MTSSVKNQLQAELIRRLLSDQKKIPRAALSRLGRTAMAALYGRRLLAAGRAYENGLDGETLDVEALFEFYIGSIFKYHLYNCDPHPGNYLFLQDGRIAILDYGCTREFDPIFVSNLKKLTLAVHCDETQTLHNTLVEIGIVKEKASYDFDLARDLLRAFYGPMLRDEDTVIDLGDAIRMKCFVRGKRQLMKLTLPGEFLFLLRIRFGLMSILAKLGSQANWYQLERQWLEG